VRGLRGIGGRWGDAAVALGALVVLATSWARIVRVSAAAIEVLPAEVALGPVPEGEDRVVRLVVANRGAEPVEVTVVPSCTCMVPDRGAVPLGPRASAEISVRVSTARKPGWNAAHVQVANAAGAVVAQSTITFLAVREFVFEPPTLFLRAGDGHVVARASCLTRLVPESLSAVASDPALAVAVRRAGVRVWELEVALAGRPRAGLASVRVVAAGAEGPETVGEIAVSVPSTRIGDVRIAPVAEALPGGRARAWVLVDGESACEYQVKAVRALSGEMPAWHAGVATDATGSRLWIGLDYPATAAGGVVELVIAAGSVDERVEARLPEGTGP
jgi:hypothetical protein